MRKLFLGSLPFLALALSVNSWGASSQLYIPIKGAVLPLSENLGSICMVRILVSEDSVTKKEKLEVMRKDRCSAVLIDGERLLTSAHCLWDEMTESNNRVVSVSCGSRGAQNFKVSIERTAKGFTAVYHPEYPDQYTTDRQIAADIGMIIIPQKITSIEPLKIISQKQLEAFRRDPAKNCRISGYGQTEYNSQGGLLYTAELSDEFAKNLVVEGEAIKTHASKRDLPAKSTIAPGDSGGALYCLVPSDNDPKTKEWVLVGINSGGRGITSSGWFNPVIRMFWSLARTEFSL